MVRMSIDLPEEDHKKLKVLACVNGTTLRNLVLDCVFDKIYSNIKEPNEETKRAMKDAEQGNTTEYKTLEDFWKEMGLQVK